MPFWSEPAARWLGMASAAAMPFFNIPLIVRIARRRSSADISVAWVVGVEACILGMLPSGLRSPDPVLWIFAIVNSAFFTMVFAVVLWFHPAVRRRAPPPSRPDAPLPRH